MFISITVITEVYAWLQVISLIEEGVTLHLIFSLITAARSKEYIQVCLYANLFPINKNEAIYCRP